jgi:hypothetical protein
MAIDPTLAYPRSTANEPTRDASMIGRTAIGQQLISSDIALALCKMVITHWCGEDECDAQLPFTVEDGSNVWKVRGSRVLKPGADASDRGPICMSISKLDAAIVSFTE